MSGGRSSEDNENRDDSGARGIVAPVAGTVGTMMATETIKVLLGIDSGLQGNLWVYDGMAATGRNINIPVKPDCPVCGNVKA